MKNDEIKNDSQKNLNDENIMEAQAKPLRGRPRILKAQTSTLNKNIIITFEIIYYCWKRKYRYF